MRYFHVTCNFMSSCTTAKANCNQSLVLNGRLFSFETSVQEKIFLAKRTLFTKRKKLNPSLQGTMLLFVYLAHPAVFPFVSRHKDSKLKP